MGECQFQQIDVVKIVIYTGDFRVNVGFVSVKCQSQSFEAMQSEMSQIIGMSLFCVTEFLVKKKKTTAVEWKRKLAIEYYDLSQQQTKRQQQQQQQQSPNKHENLDMEMRIIHNWPYTIRNLH